MAELNKEEPKQGGAENKSEKKIENHTGLNRDLNEERAKIADIEKRLIQAKIRGGR